MCTTVNGDFLISICETRERGFCGCRERTSWSRYGGGIEPWLLYGGGSCSGRGGGSAFSLALAENKERNKRKNHVHCSVAWGPGITA